MLGYSSPACLFESEPEDSSLRVEDRQAGSTCQHLLILLIKTPRRKWDLEHRSWRISTCPLCCNAAGGTSAIQQCNNVRL